MSATTLSPGRRPVSAWRELRPSALVLPVLAAWEWSGADLWVSSLLADPVRGFAWRAHPVLVSIFHDGGRLLAGLVLLALLMDLLRSEAPARPSRAQRGMALGLIVLCMVLVSLLKRWALTSCPWDVLGLGGTVPYVPHWHWTRADGGPGHCFPSGHASAAFAFFPLFFLWRHRAPRLASMILAGIWTAGLLFGATQILRGAHYLSHVAWTAWICWTISALTRSRYDVVHSRRHHGRSPDNRPQEPRAA
jgi:membrane-associated PAP2 superfamily phosphatase